MKRLLLIAFAGCGGEVDYPSGDCVQMSMDVSQSRGVCALDKSGLFNEPLTQCVLVQWAYCGTDCPQGWSLSCEGPEPAHDCTYDGMCTDGTQGRATYDAVQTYNGQRGLLVDVGERCEFRPCL